MQVFNKNTHHDMRAYIHRGDIHFALLLAFFLTWYRVLAIVEASILTPLNIARLAINFVAIATMLEVIFGLICYLRKKPLFGRAKSRFFSWKRTLPVSAVISAAGILFYYFELATPIAGQTIWALVIGFAIGTILTMLYFYSLVEKK